MIRRLNQFQSGLGKGVPRKVITSSALISVTTFFYLLSLVSFFQPIVYPFVDRITYPSYFEDKYFVNYLVDSLIIISCTIAWFQISVADKKKYILISAFVISFVLSIYFNIEYSTKIIVLFSLPAMLLFIILGRLSNKILLHFNFQLTVNYISVFAVLLAIFSFVVIIDYVIFPDSSLPQLNFVYYFFMILSIFSPIYLLLISFSYPIAMSIQILKKKWRKISVGKPNDIIMKQQHVKLKAKLFLLSLLVLLSVIVCMIPHLSTVNKDAIVIGTDTQYYMRFLETMADSSGYDEVIYKAFAIVVTGDRPLSVLFFYWLASTFYQGNFYLLLEDLPFLLSPLLVISTYFLTLGITRNETASLIASFITIPSHMLIGIYAGLYANWFSLIWGYLAILLLFKVLEQPKKSNLIIFSTLLILVILSHVSTWTIFMYVIGIFLVILFIKKIDSRKPVLFAFMCILPSIFIDIARMILVSSSGVKQEVNFALTREVGLHGINTIWNNLIETSHLYWTGQIANPIILLLIICWLYNTKLKANYAIFFVVFFSLVALTVLFADETIQSRFFYEIPFQVPAAIALVALKERIGSYMPFAICLWLIVMSLYMVSNFVLVVPERYL